jgi:transcriptional regulator GlxA family with amidase domain
MAVRKVAIVIHGGVQALDVAGPVDVFAEANGYVAEGSGYETVLVAADRELLRASNGMKISADLGFDDADGRFDIVLVAGGPALPEAPSDPELTQWLRRVPERAELYGSICTGAFALGHAGLLDGHQVTTHWQNAKQLAARFPDAEVVPDRIYIRDRRLMTSAGVTAGNFGRAFAQATGITPHEFVEQARIDAARRLLEGSDRPLKAVAFDCGFGSADRMRIVFSERLGVSPAHYRASFRKV